MRRFRVALTESAWRAITPGLTKLPIATRRRLLFLNAHKRLPEEVSPQKFSDKVNWRILNDRRPSLAWTCDKLGMKRNVADVPGIRIPETLWAGTDLALLSQLDFPDRWILKANHRSQCVYIGRGQPTLDQLINATVGWLTNWEADFLGEWAYSEADPAILLEEWIGDGDVPPTDYKFYTFDGQTRLILTTQGRFHDEKTVLYDRNWERLDVSKGPTAWQGDLTRPAHLTEMVQIAESVGRSFDFMRVDLFDTSAGVYFGETTPYPGGGLTAFRPESFDDTLGSYWRLPEAH